MKTIFMGLVGTCVVITACLGMGYLVHTAVPSVLIRNPYLAGSGYPALVEAGFMPLIMTLGLIVILWLIGTTIEETISDITGSNKEKDETQSAAGKTGGTNRTLS